MIRSSGQKRWSYLITERPATSCLVGSHWPALVAVRLPAVVVAEPANVGEFAGVNQLSAEQVGRGRRPEQSLIARVQKAVVAISNLKSQLRVDVLDGERLSRGDGNLPPIWVTMYGGVFAGIDKEFRKRVKWNSPKRDIT